MYSYLLKEGIFWCGFLRNTSIPIDDIHWKKTNLTVFFRSMCLCVCSVLWESDLDYPVSLFSLFLPLCGMFITFCAFLSVSETHLASRKNHPLTLSDLNELSPTQTRWPSQEMWGATARAQITCCNRNVAIPNSTTLLLCFILIENCIFFTGLSFLRRRLCYITWANIVSSSHKHHLVWNVWICKRHFKQHKFQPLCVHDDLISLGSMRAFSWFYQRRGRWKRHQYLLVSLSSYLVQMSGSGCFIMSLLLSFVAS